MKKSVIHLLALPVSVLLAGPAFGAGFAVSEQSASALGTAYAGTGVLGEDASYQFYNPATLALFDETQLSVALHYLYIDTDFEDGNPGTPGNFDDVKEPIGSAFLAVPMGSRDDVVFGLTINAPHGTILEYDPFWGGVDTGGGFSTGELYAQKSDLKTINVNPAVSWRINDMVSIGAGISWQRLEAELENAATRLKGDDDAWGWNIGALVEFLPGHRIGVSWRESIDYDVEGDVTFSPEGIAVMDPSLPPAAIGALAGKYDADTSVTLPAVANLAYAGRITDETELLLGMQWTEWSELDQFTITHRGQAAGLPPLVETLRWDNSVRTSIGVRQMLSDEVLLRVGYARETSTQGDAAERSALVPDEDRDWFTIGARFTPRSDMNIDVAYAYVRVDDARIARMDRGPLVGEYEMTAHIVGAQLNWMF